MMMMMKDVEKRLVNALAEEVQSYVLGNMFHLEENPYLKLQLSKHGISVEVYLSFDVIDKGYTFTIENVDIVDISMSCDTYQVAEEVEQALQPFTAEFPELRKQQSKFFKQTLNKRVKDKLESEISKLVYIVDGYDDSGYKGFECCDIELIHGLWASVEGEVSCHISYDYGTYETPACNELEMDWLSIDSLKIFDENENEYTPEEWGINIQNLDIQP